MAVEMDHGLCFLFGKRQGTLAVSLCIALFALLVRVAVSLHSYFGAAIPKFGDFEARRHWMDIILNLPVKECLGLAVGAIDVVLSGKDLVASVLFCLSLNHKQVLSRLAPFERGIYEHYVANFWCTSSVLIKWKRIFSTGSLRLISLAATVLACLPSMVLNPSSKGFLYPLLNCSFAVYMSSFQVHEKSILLPLLATTLFAVELGHPFMLLRHYALCSMFPRLSRNKWSRPVLRSLPSSCSRNIDNRCLTRFQF